LQQVADTPGVAATVFGALADAHVNVDMIVQNVSENGKATDLTFTVGKNDLQPALKVLESLKDQVKCRALVPDPNVVKVSIVGMGMRSHAGVAQTMFAALAEKGINIQVISTSEIKVSVLIAEEYTELAVRTLHSAFNLDAA
jgi:aspartate kinase